MGRVAAFGAVLALFVVVSTVNAHCPNNCNGHGDCHSGHETKCACWAAWGGADCSLRLCPSGIAWADDAIATDTAHLPATECSAKGTCDYTTGKCACEEGYEGLACQRMSCRKDCLYRGRCVSMRRHAINFRHIDHLMYYNTVWDADLIHGCECDPAYEGHDCSLRKCPRGDDPMTHDQYNEVQVIHCTADSGFFILSLENLPSLRIAADADTYAVKLALEGVTDTVDVTFPAGDTTVCDADGAETRIEFLQRFGDVPGLTVYTDWARNLECVGACTPGLDLYVEQTFNGTKEWEYCSRRGRCNQENGLCECYQGYYSSNGQHEEGQRGDCGAALDPITSCPGSPLECSGHGVCNDFPEYKCSCFEGWTAGDCAERICPFGPAWFDLPFDDSSAHAQAECSNKGICDRLSGRCTCEQGFAGEACERMRCPHVGEADECSGHGRCMSMQQLAENADLNGDATDYYYGRETHRNATWDHHSMYGCKCDEGYHGYDCSLRTCPTGDDPNTIGQVFERQTITCTADAGYVVLSFRQDLTDHINFDDDAATVKAKLEALDTIGTVTVGFSTGVSDADPFCTAGGTNAAEIQFESELGNVPMLIVEEDTLSLTAGTAVFNLVLTEDGTKEDATCSNRGICNEETGVCQCFTQWGSSNGNNQPGDRADCGYRLPFIPVEQSQIDYQWWKARNHEILLRDTIAPDNDDQFVH